jgi:hypothetical protein
MSFLRAKIKISKKKKGLLLKLKRKNKQQIRSKQLKRNQNLIFKEEKNLKD